MKKHAHILFFALAAIMPLIFMLAYRFAMEGWGEGYAVGMFLSCACFMALFIGLGANEIKPL